MSHWDDISIAILAGGQSTRMGRDKAEMGLGGETMLTSIARLALETGAPVVVVGRDHLPGWYLTDANEYEPRGEASFAPDQPPQIGPLGGLLGALRWNALSIHRRPRLLLLPCDVPLLEASALEWIADAASTCSSRHGLATTRGGMLEPMFSLYFADVEEHARQYAASRRRSLHGLIESGDFKRAECPAEIASQLFNCNTPQDLEAARSGRAGA